MRAAAVNPIRAGFHTITPYVTVPQAGELIDFVKSAFGAQELFRGAGSAGGIHAEVRIGDSMMMQRVPRHAHSHRVPDSMIEMGDARRHSSGMVLPPMTTGIYLYVPDAGAASLFEPADQPYGDRLAGVQDFCGNRWYIATHIADAA